MAVQKIGRYRLLRELGRGSAAVVYQGRDPDSGKQVAIKVFYANVIAAEGFGARFAQLLPALAALEHPSLVPLVDYGQEGGEDAEAEVAYFLVQRYMPGGTLAERMDGRPMLLAEVVPILQRLAEALDAAHTARLLHGDVNPAHVMFDLHNRAFLADLGLEMLLTAAPAGGTLPLPGMPAARPTGTPAYLSPEQITGLPLDGRADVYALGVMVFEMLTGRQPYVADRTGDLLLQHLEAPVPQLSEAQLARLVLPSEFNHVLARALAKSRDARYPTAGILAEAMRAMFLMAPGELAALDERVVAPPQPVTLPPPSASPALPVVEAPPTETEPPPPAEASPPAEPLAPSVDAAVEAAPPLAVPAAPVAEAATAEAAGEPSEAEGEPAEAPDDAPAPEPAAAHAHAHLPEATVVSLAPSADEAPIVTEWEEAPDPAPRRALPGWSWVGGGLVLLLLLWMVWRSPAVRAIVNPPTATPTATATATVTLTPTVTRTPSATPTVTQTRTPTPTVTATLTPRPTNTRLPTITPPPSHTAPPTATATFLPTWTPEPSVTVPSAPLNTATP